MKFFKLKNTLIITFFCTISALSVSAQLFHYSDTTSVSIFSGVATLGVYDMSTCSIVSTSGISSIRFSDLTLHPNGILYGFGYHILYGTHLMCRFALPSYSTFILTEYPQDSVKALTCDETGVIFAAGHGLSTYDVNTETFSYLGDLPPEMWAQGDLIIYEGQLYLSTVSNTLVEVDTANPLNSTVFMNFPPGTPPIQGLAKYWITCDSSVVYAIGSDSEVQKIYRIDFENQELIEVCDNYQFFEGVAAVDECIRPPCQVYLDLDFDDSSNASGNDFFSDTLCQPPVKITGDDVFMDCDLPAVDSVVLTLSGIQNVGQEYLEVDAVNNLFVYGSGTSNIVMVNDGNASFADFSSALSGIIFKNDATAVQFGLRQVTVVAWSEGFYSQPAVSNILLANTLQTPQTLVTDVTCHGAADGSISIQAVGGNFPYIYNWGNGITGSFIGGLTPGFYPLTITDDGGCEMQDTFHVTQPDTLTATLTYTGPPVLCDNSGELSATVNGGTEPYTYAWSNGVGDPSNPNIGPGDYELTISDSNGCMATAGYAIAEGDTVLVVQTEAICEGESFDWGGAVFQDDTLICQVFTLPNGCDSTACLSLVVHPLPAVEITVEGDFCTADVVMLMAGQHEAYLWSTGETMEGISTASPGNFSVTVSNALGCEAAASVDVPPGVEFSWSASDPTCFGETDGHILAENVSGGTPPWVYSIDGEQFFPDGNFEDLPAGSYLLSVEDAVGCRSEVEVVLEAPAAIQLDAGEDRDIRLGESVTLAATTSLADPLVTWWPPDFLDCPDCLTTPAHPVRTVLYEIEVQDENGCSERDSLTVFVDTESRAYVPNAFSPNGDGINDRLSVFADVSVVSVRSFKVFDRWGALVFHAENLPPNDPAQGWDGTFKGKTVQAGVYVYLLVLKRMDGVEETVSGEVVLLL